jgi:hypothetical protein
MHLGWRAFVLGRYPDGMEKYEKYDRYAYLYHEERMLSLR